jgi:MFS transporter, SP family, general alpha glucoside:H+ symporter
MLLLLSFLIIIGIISVLPLEPKPAGLTVGSLLLVFTLAYNCTVGPITYSLVSELPSTRLKSKTINLARACYLVVGLINGVITPLMLNPQSANWGAKTAWFWAGITAACATYTYFSVPEPKDLTYGQIDQLYSEKINARLFKAAGQRLRERSLAENASFGWAAE